MNTELENFILQIFNDTSVDIATLGKYEDSKFRRELQLYALMRIKCLLFSLLELHVHDTKNHKTISLSEAINKQDHLGCNILDYCILAGIPELAFIVASLGCRLDGKTRYFQHVVYEYLATHKDSAVNAMRQAIVNAAHGADEYKESIEMDKYRKLTFFNKVKRFFSKQGVWQHKTSGVLLLFGVVCLVAAPFTGSASMLLLISLGLPAIFAAISDFNTTSRALAKDRIESEHNRTGKEVRMIRMLVNMVLDQEFRITDGLPHKRAINQHIYDRIHESNPEGMLFYLNNVARGDSHTSTEASKESSAKITLTRRITR